jgi:hypothetical protein
MTEATPEISFRYEETIDHDPEINPATDYLIECKRCGELRHKSWFQVNWPACAACMQFDKLFLDNLTTELIMRDPQGIMPQFSPGPDLSIADMKLKPLSPDRPVKRRRR